MPCVKRGCFLAGSVYKASDWEMNSRVKIPCLKAPPAAKPLETSAGIYSVERLPLPPGFTNRKSCCYANTVVHCLMNISTLKHLCSCLQGIHSSGCMTCMIQTAKINTECYNTWKVLWWMSYSGHCLIADINTIIETVQIQSSQSNPWYGSSVESPRR